MAAFFMETNQALILFDGVCNLCQGTVQWIFKRDKKDQFVYASLQDKSSQDLLQQYGYDANAMQSVVVVHDKKIYTQSSAALKVVMLLGFPYSVLTIAYLVPTVIRNYVYQWIAKNRYKWFGKQESCWLPRPEWANKFPKEFSSWLK